ncbi:Lrp/AsnC family transcriptional regulator [Streptomyces mexicanus]|uniref:Lrp/AsnC family transcriptional regulator n=1 Tax=Streptomyces mexicanus TaxID=178566 RepID=UPI0031F0C56A
MSSPDVPVDDLDRRIIAALQIDGRASWRRIARVLGEPERTVARRGLRLLENRLVTVTALVPSGDTVVVRLRCRPDATREAALAVARRTDTIFTYVVSGSSDCVAELQCPPGRLADLMLEDLPALPGLTEQQVCPVLRYFRTVHEWHPGILTPQEAAQLRRFPTPDDAVGVPEVELDPEERAIVAGLAQDGRRTHEELAALAGVSEATARRRVEALSQAGVVSIRASVEPALLGLPVEALLWLRVRPDALERVGRLAVDSPLVRYAAVVTGEQQLLVHVTQPSKDALLDHLAGASWAPHVEAVEAQYVVEPLKRSATPTPALRRLLSQRA